MKSKSQKDAYLISFSTFVIQPVVEENKMMTQVVEENGLLLFPRKPLHIVSKSCLYYGKSLQTATNSSKLILHKRHKLPIIVAHDFGKPLILMPTMAASSSHNLWIALHAMENFKGDNMGCKIYLTNDYSFDINVSEGTMQRQYTLACLLERNFQIKQRKLIGSSKLIID